MRKSQATARHRAECHSHYKRNKKHYKARNALQRERTRAFIESLKVGRPCADCGEKFLTICMDFDHVGSSKQFNVSESVSKGLGKMRILGEISKCELVCSNCHRIRTSVRRNVRKRLGK